ncbi:MAG: aminotransferase class V-fold PLP-dependent enzyme [Candidatus Lokiarchaeota archaeon]|nr:aminotransferase class V-fold PLP-dependent enzyme [Candidatus Lokiarchaeota archaeon]MBD3199686.1 aminotransferase class V-fold PLP-dependent enzyme [Candidatus Lokiarchaeota archaeon]
MKIQFNDLSKQWEVIKDTAKVRLDKLFEKSDFIGGKAIEVFEKNFAEFCGTEFAIGVSNGTDAIKLSLASLNIKNKCGVIIPANTFIATVLAPTYLRDLDHKLVLIDCDEYYQMDVALLEECLEENRKKWNSCVIIPVHLYGHPCNIKKTMELAKQYDCFVLEDSSQAHGAEVLNKRVGGFGDISAFSLYPGKNLGAAGDAGIITTNDEDLYKKVKSLRNYGSSKKYYYDFLGWNNRLDTIQAIILDEKLKYLDEWNNNRIQVAEKYNKELNELEDIILPKTAPYIEKQVFHIYAIRTENRDDLQAYLNKKEIPTVIHYPIPIQETKLFKYLDKNNNQRTKKYSRQLLSLPIHPFMEDNEIIFITDTIKEFYQ